MRVRPAAVAGTFYPADPVALATMVDGYLTAAPAAGPSASARPPVAIIAPHAGFVYSGPVAGHAFAALRRWSDAFDRVVVVGVPHRAPVRGLALCSAEAWDTPLGRIAVDADAAAALLTHPGAYLDDRAHAHEHSLEVHLPFLQRVLVDGWRLLPVIAGGAMDAADTGHLADLLAPWWGAARTLVVVSTDLSHYQPQRAARALDEATAADIEAARWELLDGARACGASGVRAALELTRRHHERVTLLDLRTSADTAGSEDRVVGYGSFVIR